MASVKRASYRVILERDETGAWIARAPSVRGCHTHGRTLEQARRRLEEVRLPTEARDAIRRSRRARSEAEQQREEAQAATSEAARALVQELHLGLRDAGELLGLSYQRVQQLVRG